jgi:membrane protein required for colicin V production
MSTLDICIAICFVPFIIKGISKGFIAQAIALISIVLGVWIAFKFTKLVCGWVFPEAASHTIAYVITFLLILVGVIIGLYLLGKLLQISLKFVMLGWVDKALGILFAVLEAALILGLIFILFNTINVKFHLVNVETLDKSLFFNPLKNFADTVFPYLKLLLFK